MFARLLVEEGADAWGSVSNGQGELSGKTIKVGMCDSAAVWM